jgi:gliding motility-associated-like protein
MVIFKAILYYLKMKKIFYVAILSLLSHSYFSQTNIHESVNLRPQKVSTASNPNLVYLDATKTFNLPVDGGFLYSSLEGEMGTNSSGYGNNEDYTLTIHNQYDRTIFLKSHYLFLENNDVLEIYDGADMNAPLVKTVSGVLDRNFLIQSTGTDLTLHFKSDNSGTSRGFRFRMDNGPGTNNRPAAPLPVPMACASTPAADECVNAPLICDLNGYCGNTSGSYSAGNTSGLGNFCGSIENNSWLSFVASGTSASLNFNSGGCQDSGSGIQAVIYASSNCTSFTEVSNCESQGSGSGTFTITTNVNLVPGQTYYVMVDGFAGNICSYTVGAQSGVALGQQITGPSQVCPGQSATLGASSTASSYNWTSTPPGVYPNTQTITITPTVTTTYTLTMGSSACTPTGVTIVKTVTVTNTLNPANITAPPLVCYGSNVSLTSLTNGGTYIWNGPASFTSNVQSPTINNWTPANNGVYSLTINYGGGCSTLPSTVSITGVAAPTVNIAAAPSLTVCAGQSLTLTASGGSGSNPGYTWTWPLGQSITLQTCVSVPIIGLQCTNFPGLFPGVGTWGPKAVLTPTASQQICASFENATGCVGQKCVNIVVLPAAAALTVTAAPATICPGQSSTLTVSGGTTYTWSPAATLSSANGATVNATPAATTIYTVSTTVCGGTIVTKTVQVTVNGTPPAIGAISGPTTICPNQTGVTYSVSNVASTNYTWTVPAGASITSGANTNAITVNFGASAGTVSVIAVGTCGTATASINVSLNPPLSLTVTPNAASICAGSSTTLTASGATSYTWSPAATLSSANGTAVTATPVTTTTYTVIGATGTCTGTTTAVVSINPSLSLTVTPNSANICPGATTTLTATGATNYTWSPSGTLSSANGSVVTASPVTATTYTVLGASGTCTGVATATVNMNGTLSLTVSPATSSVCPGGSTILTASGATNYTWSPAGTLSSANGSTVSATPGSATTYTVIGATGTCTGSATANVTIGAALTLTLSSNTPTVCPGGSALLDANGATTYTWSPAGTLSSANGSNVTATPLANTIYTVIGSTGGCTGTSTISVNIGVCVSSGCNLAAIRAALTSAGNIELLGMNNTCSLYFINPQFMTGPQAQAYAQTFGANLISVQSAAENADLVQALANQGYSSEVIWIGYSDAITEGSYVWYDGSPLSYSNWAPGEPNDAGGVEDCTQIYPDGSWNDLNCSGYNSLSVIEVNLCPQVTVTTPTIHCPGTNVTLNASTLLGSPGYTYTWVQSGAETFTNTSTPGNTDQITVTSMGANTFTVYSEDRYSCPQSAIATLSVNPNPTVTVNTATICMGQQTATLTANGASTYTWTPGTGLSATTGAVVNGNPVSTQAYTVSGTDGNGCTGNATTTITVNSLPTITTNSATICAGQQTATLTANGAVTYSWIPGTGLSSTTASVVTGTPGSTQNYTLVGMDANGCLNGTITTIAVNPLPTVTVNSATICLGQQTATLTANGASTYSWIPGTGLSGTTGAVVTGTPGATENYTVVGVDANGCINGTTTAIFVNSLPTVTVNSSTICLGQQTATLTANGATNYTWSPGTGLSATTGAVVNGTPVSTQAYTITGADANGCTATATSTITVNSLPTVTTNSASICVGQQTATLTANGAVTYSWIPGTGLSSTTASVVTGTPGSTQNYTLVGMDANGCLNGTITSIFVNSLPTVTVNSGTICLGQQTATLTANGASTYSWSPATGLNVATGAAVTGTPTSTQNYTVVGTDVNGCYSDATSTIVVNATPTITVNSATICLGQQTATLSANGADTYTWSPGTGLSSINAGTVTGTPVATENYTLTGTDINGCYSSTTATITVSPIPTVTVADATVCPASSATLTASGATNYTWTPNQFLNTAFNGTVISTPSVTTTYTIDAETASCVTSTVVTVTISNTVVVNASASTSTICPLASSSLSATGAANYTWTPAISLNTNTGGTVVATPAANETYTVIGATGTCTNSAQVVITVTVNPTVTVASVAPICSASGTAALAASGASTYTWSPNTALSSTVGANVNANPSTTQTYTVNGTSPLGCTNFTTVVVTVVPTPTVTTLANPLTICDGSVSVLSAFGATNYTWSPSADLSSATGSPVNASPSLSTVFTVTGSNGTGASPDLCTSTNTIAVNVLPKTPAIPGPVDPICFGTSTSIYATGGNTYNWQPSIGVSNPNDSTTYVSPMSTTVYTVTVSRNGLCPSTATIEVVVNPLPIVDAGRDTTINIDETYVLHGSLTSSGPIIYGFLSPDGNPLVCNFCPVVEVAPDENTCYTLKGENLLTHCVSTDVICIEVTRDWNVYIPNAFSPNGDLNNDVFIPVGYGLEEIKLTIFDRWGEVIFKSNGDKIGWDGNSKAGKPCEQNVYVYLAEIKTMAGNTIKRTGHVTLLSRVK